MEDTIRGGMYLLCWVVAIGCALTLFGCLVDWVLNGHSEFQYRLTCACLWALFPCTAPLVLRWIHEGER